nr:hypothetical protein [Myxococcota bacterium]
RVVRGEERDDPDQRRAIAVLLESLGGLTFRGDGPGTALARSLGVALRHGPALLRGGVPLLRDVLRRLAPEGSLRFALRWIRGRERVAYLNLVSHHFMSADELDTPKGRERLDACAFQASIDGELVPMCAVNARGIRDELYASLRGESEAPTLPVAASHRLPEAVSNRPGAAA